MILKFAIVNKTVERSNNLSTGPVVGVAAIGTHALNFAGTGLGWLLEKRSSTVGYLVR